MVSPLYFVLGSIIGVILQIVAVVIQSQEDGYSIWRSQLSYSGNRKDFYHEKYDRHFKRAVNPTWFNSAFMIGGLFYAIGAFTLTNLTYKILIFGFGFCLIFVGYYDVGTNYKNHSIAILASQAFFMPLLFLVLMNYYSIPLLIFSLILLFFIVWYLYTKIANTLNYNPNRITIAQRVGVLLESIFMIIFPFLLI